MQTPFEIVKLDSPAWEVIGSALTDFNTEQAGDEDAKRLCFVVRDDDGTILGGVIGVVYWDWLSLDLMWVREDLRGQGYGSQLLTRIEQEAQRLGARHVHLDTFSFQAPGFYQKYGYAVFGQLEDFPSGFQRIYMVKAL